MVVSNINIKEGNLERSPVFRKNKSKDLVIIYNYPIQLSPLDMLPNDTASAIIDTFSDLFMVFLTSIAFSIPVLLLGLLLIIIPHSMVKPGPAFFCW